MPDSDSNNNGYASTAIHLPPMIYFLLIFAASLALILGGIRLFYSVSASKRIAQSVADSPALDQPLQPSPSHPTLPWEDMQRLRDSQQDLLHNGGPDPNDPTHMHIPIDRAIDMLLKSGALTRRWAPTTQPWQRPANEKTSSVENRT